MEDEKEKMNPFFKVLIALFIIFIGFYIALESGYYPSRVEKRTILTNKNIESFENDIKEGRKISTEGTKLFFKKSRNSYNRICFALPRGYGTAVQRNHSKRLSREAYRQIKSHLNTGYDIILLVYPGNDTFSTRCEQIRYLFKKAGIFII